jgi:adenylate cyclase
VLTVSVRGRFLLAFLGISAFAVLAAAAAMWAFLELGQVVARITEERTPAALASLELSRQAERIAAAAPALLAARSEEARTRVAARIRAQFTDLEALRAHLRTTATDPSALMAIERAVSGLDRNLDALDGLVAERLSAARRKDELLRRLSTTLIGAHRLVAPGILVLESKLGALRRNEAETSAGLSETVARFVPLQKAKLEFAAVNENLLRTAEAGGIADLPLLAFPLRRSLDALEALTSELEPQLQERFAERVRELEDLADGPGSLPAAREQELQALARGERLLAEIATLSGGLTEAVDRLVAAAKGDITAAGSEAATVRRTSTGVLLATVMASLLSSAVIVWLYVDRNLVSRLRELAQSMLAIAGGNLKAPLPAAGPDELGQMAKALRVFRDTAVEVEEQRLRERQVVLDTIDYGVLILDPALRVRMYNRAFRDLWELPDEILRVRHTLEELLLAYRGRGLHGVPDVGWDDYVARRVAEVRAGSTAPQEWHRPDGRVLQYEIVALPDGGRMLTYFDLTRLKRTEEALIAAKRQAELASQAKSAFLASMSHELRTPLNAIIGFTRIVMRRAKDALPARQYGNLEKILVSGEHLLSLINSILDLSKIEAGRMEVKRHPVALRPLLEFCLATVRPLVRGGAVELVEELEAAPPMLVSDEEKLKQIVINLLSNAAKFTEKGSIVLRASERDGTVEISVRDTGIGMPGDKLEMIFEEFRQVDGAMAGAQSGTGLGLSISRRLARLLGGEITVASEVGRGSTFTLTLPLQQSAMATLNAPSTTGPPVPPRPAAERAVLAIDDDPNVQSQREL